jgi:hypothetical protein
MMRPVTSFFFISVLLFLTGIGFVIAAGRTAKFGVTAEAPAPPRSPPIATVKQVMAGITMPAAQAIWDSVSTVVSSEGVEEKQPRTDAEWAAVAANAAVLAESANMLVGDGRAIDNGDWVKFATALRSSASQALTSAQKHDPDGILRVGEQINASCDACHQRYLRQ